MTKRQRLLVRMALVYMGANLDDVLDAFASTSEDDPDNEAGTVTFEGQTVPSPSFEEIERLVVQGL